ncbi:MAG: hypothetical protein ABIS51_10690 [Sphingomonas sp.]
MPNWLEEYSKLFALNFGQACQGVRYLFSHPKIDRYAPAGSPQHVCRSIGLRSHLVANDLMFAVLPPRWHHTREELAGMRAISWARWFQYGYCAWRFTETGEVRADLSSVDRRWDPRCDD